MPFPKKKKPVRKTEPTFKDDASSTTTEPGPAVKHSPDHNSGWFTYRNDTNIALVFVHGFLSNSEGCWTAPSEVFWPTLVTQDDRLPPVSVFLGGYHTAIDSVTYGIKDCANELRKSLAARRSNGQRSVTDFNTIVFVCHSLGGIVTRYMLDAYRPMFKAKTIGLVLVASPSLGSRYANFAAGLAALFGNRVAKQLRHEAELITDLDDRFRELLSETQDFRLLGIELVEDRGPLHTRLTPWIPRIVGSTSASRYFGPTNTIPKTDHSSIAKPDSATHPSHQHLVDFLCSKMGISSLKAGNLVKISEPLRASRAELTEKELLNRVLFDIFDPACAPYYLHRELDNQVANHMQFGSVWLSGNSGLGKTSVLRSYLNSENVLCVEVPLAHCANNLNAERCIQEIMETMMPENAEALRGRSLSAVATALGKKAHDRNVVLFLDEVPIRATAPEEINDFVKFISDLSTLLRLRADDIGRAKMLIASIESPLAKGVALSEKVREQLNFLTAGSWSGEELHALYAKVVVAAPSLEIDQSTLANLIEASNGSPRFFKTFFRNKIVFGSSNDAETLAKTTERYDW